MRASFSQTEPIKVYPYMEWGIGGVGLVLVLFPAFLATATNHYLMGMSFFFLAFCCVLLIIRGGILLVDDHILSVTTLLARNQIRWDEVDEIETGPSGEVVLHGSSVDTLKTLVIPGSMYWFEHKKQLGAVFVQQVKRRKIRVKKTNRPLWFVFSSKTTRVDMNTAAPENYASLTPDIYEVNYEQVPNASVSQHPMPPSKGEPDVLTRVTGLGANSPSDLELVIQMAISSRHDNTSDILLGTIAGSVAALFGAVAWGGIGFVTQHDFRFAAVGIGVLVGHATRLFSQKGSVEMGVISAALSVAGCIVGSALAVLMVATNGNYPDVLNTFLLYLTHPMWLVNTYALTFHPIDVLFYLIAVVYAFRVASQ